LTPIENKIGELSRKCARNRSRKVLISAAKGLLLIVVMLTVTASAAPAQTQFASQDTQIWNDDLATVGLSKRDALAIGLGIRKGFDAYYLVRLGGGFSLVPREREFGPAKFQITLFPHYDYYVSTKMPMVLQEENRFSPEITPSVSLKCWKLADRNRGEARFMQGNLAWRYRNRIEIDHPAPWKLAAFASYEFFYDASKNTWHEARFAAGAGHPLCRNLAIQVYYVRQWHGSPPGNVNALGITFNMSFREKNRGS
jgi:hypothetical protein